MLILVFCYKILKFDKEINHLIKNPSMQKKCKECEFLTAQIANKKFSSAVYNV